MFVFLFSTLLSQIYSAVVEAVLAGIECYAKTSTESKVNEAPCNCFLSVIVDLDCLQYEIYVQTKMKTKMILMLRHESSSYRGLQPVSEFCLKEKKKKREISECVLILPICSWFFHLLLNFPDLIVRKMRSVKEQILAWCISVLLFSVSC